MTHHPDILLSAAATTLAGPPAAARRCIARVCLVLLLVMGHLSLGLGALADGHLLGAHDHHPPAAESPGGGDQGCADPCDHCCHAGAHLLALPPATGIGLALARSAPRSQDDASWASRPNTPPRRPPRSSL